MPLFTLIEPVNVSKSGSGVQGNIGEDLEKNAGLTLSNIILQLSKVSLRGGEIFQDLLEEASNLNEKYTRIRNRIEELKSEIGKLNPESDNKSEFRRDRKSDKTNRYEKVLTTETLSKALRDQYNKCEPPPPFEKFFGEILAENQETYNSQEVYKMYTNPDYFQEIWNEQKKKEKVKKRIMKNKFAKLQNVDVQETLQNNEKFYPVQIHKEKPRVTNSRSRPESPHSYAYPSLFLSQGEYTPHSTYDPVVYAEPYYSTQIDGSYNTIQGGSDDDSSLIYEVFDSDTENLSVGVGLDRVSTVATKKFKWQSFHNRVTDTPTVDTEYMEPSCTTEYVSPQQSIDMEPEGARTTKTPEPRQRRESMVKILLESSLLQRRRVLTVHSNSESEYTYESSSESADTGASDQIDSM